MPWLLGGLGEGSHTHAPCSCGPLSGPLPRPMAPEAAPKAGSKVQEPAAGVASRGPPQGKHGSSPLPVRQAQPCSWQDPGFPSGLLSHSPPANSPPRFLFHPQLLPLLRRGTHIAKSCLGPTSYKQHSSPPGDVHPEDPSTHHGKRPTDTPGSQGHVGRSGPGDLQTSLEAGA